MEPQVRLFWPFKKAIPISTEHINRGHTNTLTNTYTYTRADWNSGQSGAGVVVDVVPVGRASVFVQATEAGFYVFFPSEKRPIQVPMQSDGTSTTQYSLGPSLWSVWAIYT